MLNFRVHKREEASPKIKSVKYISVSLYAGDLGSLPAEMTAFFT
jgi:hypothetical protein